MWALIAHPDMERPAVVPAASVPVWLARDFVLVRESEDQGDLENEAEFGPAQPPPAPESEPVKRPAKPRATRSN